MKSYQVWTALYLCIALGTGFFASESKASDIAEIRRSVTFYASFDEKIQGDRGEGVLIPSTRFDHNTEKGKHTFHPSVDSKIFRIAKGRGICGGANNGGIWFDFPNSKPRDLRMGIFRALAPGEKPIRASDPQARIVHLPKVGFEFGTWHHVVLTWENIDTGISDATAVLYVDGQEVGQITNRIISMKWNADRAGIYFAVNYIGLLDELSILNRPLTTAEVHLLYKDPALLSSKSTRDQ